MAFHDRRTLDGHSSVRQSAVYIKNYRYAEERMLRMMAGWIALTPELPVKLETARQVYEDALHADALGKRLAELRSQGRCRARPIRRSSCLRMRLRIRKRGDTIERLTGIYRVLKPHLVAHYSANFAAAIQCMSHLHCVSSRTWRKRRSGTSSGGRCCYRTC
jgi:hypothetical protein